MAKAYDDFNIDLDNIPENAIELLALGIIRHTRIEYIKAYRRGDDRTTDEIERDLFEPGPLNSMIGSIPPEDIMSDWRKKALNKDYKIEFEEE